MSRLPNTPLDISKLESGAVKPELRDFRIADVLEALRAEFASVAASKGLELGVESCTASAYSDPALVEQILRTLLSSAFDHTPRGRVTLRGRAEQAVVFLEVEHSGSGIPAEQISAAQRLVNVLHLRLETTFAPARGALLALRVPRGRSAPRAARTPAPASPATQPGAIRVLLVEDDPRVREATSMLLRVEGYGVTAVASLAEAERSTQAGAPDLLVTDYRLGNGELGTQVIAALRRSLRPDLKAVLVTGDASAAARELRNDPNLRIASKPYKAQELLALIAALLAG